MEEMLEKIKSEINTIKEEQEKLEKITQNSENLKLEKKELEKERDTISDTKSGFYQDLDEKVNAKNYEFIEVNNERMRKNEEIKTLISNKKKEIRNQIASKKQFIDENRNINLEELKSIDFEKLKKEKEKLEKEIALNDITREEFETKSDEEKKEIRKAKERYLINKKRLNEINNPTFQLIEALDGKTPKEKFIELDNLDKMVEKNFDKDNLDIILKDIKSKEQEKVDIQEQKEEQEKIEKVKKEFEEANKDYSKVHLQAGKEVPRVHVDKNPMPEKIEKVKKEFEEANKDYSKVHLQAGKEVDKVHVDIKRRVKRIEITEKSGDIILIDNKMNKIDNNTTKKAFEEKNAKFKRLNIYKQCREIAGGPIKAILLQRKVNPEIVLVLENYGDQLKEYISSIYNKTELPFELVHNLAKIDLKTRFQRRRYTKMEETLGATILGKLFNKNKTLNEAEKEVVIKGKDKEKNSKPIDEYRDVIDTKTQAKNTEKILKEQEEKTAKDVQRFTGDAIIDENGNEIAEL